jgi:hypothetical protein
MRVCATPRFRVSRLQHVAVEHVRGEVVRKLEQVDLAALERQQARLRLLDDRDLDARHERQLAPVSPAATGLSAASTGAG